MWNCCRTRSSSRRAAADRSRPRAHRVAHRDHVRDSARHRASFPAAGVRPLPPGRRVDDTLARRLGLGLSIARQLVELHGGSIRASSAGSITAHIHRRLPLDALRRAPNARALPGRAPRPTARGRVCRAPVLASTTNPRAPSGRAAAARRRSEVHTASSAARRCPRRVGAADVLLSDIGMRSATDTSSSEGSSASGRARRQDAGGGADRVRAHGGPHPDDGRGLPDAPGEAGRAARAVERSRQPVGPGRSALSASRRTARGAFKASARAARSARTSAVPP